MSILYNPKAQFYGKALLKSAVGINNPFALGYLHIIYYPFLLVESVGLVDAKSRPYYLYFKLVHLASLSRGKWIKGISLLLAHSWHLNI